MFSFLTKGIEYNKVSKNLSNVLNDLENIRLEANRTYDNSYLGPHLINVVFFFKTEIIEKIEKYNWSINSPIFLGNMKKRTLGEIVSTINTEIYLIAQELRAEKCIEEILTEGDTYLRMKKNL